MVMVGFRGTGESPLSEDLLYLLEDIRAGRIGGVILFEPDHLTKGPRNVKSGQQVRNLAGLLQKEAAIPLFVAVDQEGGLVRRLKPAMGAPDTPSARKMGKMPRELVLREGLKLGRYLSDLGINLDFAPSLDVDVNQNSPAIGAKERAFAADPERVADSAGAFAAGLAQSGVLYCFKHFPGHGSAAGDTHAGLTDVSKTWSAKELDPYRRLLQKNMPGMVMAAHVFNSGLDPEFPASLSNRIIGGLLRGQLGWQGVVITDDLQMKAVTDAYGREEAMLLAIQSGADIILVGNNLEHDSLQGRKTHRAILDLARAGKISEARIRESYARILALKARLGGQRG